MPPRKRNYAASIPASVEMMLASPPVAAAPPVSTMALSPPVALPPVSEVLPPAPLPPVEPAAPCRYSLHFATLEICGSGGQQRSGLQVNWFELGSPQLFELSGRHSRLLSQSSLP